jgi:hypothetical protein
MDTITLTLSREQSFILLKLVETKCIALSHVLANRAGDAVEGLDLI